MVVVDWYLFLFSISLLLFGILGLLAPLFDLLLLFS